MKIRIASPEDAPALVEIYAPYVQDTAITFEYEVPTAEEFSDRILHTLKKYPYLVAVEEDCILGYAYASAFKARAAYSWSVETSLYVRQDLRHQGLGSALHNALEEQLRRQHVCNLCACITYPNPDSITFHEHHGYRLTAHFHCSGFKLGAWHDIVWMERELCPHTIPPLPFIPFSQLPNPSGSDT